jgi:hypothetical protein
MWLFNDTVWSRDVIRLEIKNDYWEWVYKRDTEYRRNEMLGVSTKSVYPKAGLELSLVKCYRYRGMQAIWGMPDALWKATARGIRGNESRCKDYPSTTASMTVKTSKGKKACVLNTNWIWRVWVTVVFISDKFRVFRSAHLHTFKWINQLNAAINP